MAEEEGSSSKPPKVSPKLSGKQEHYQIFNTRCKAFANMKEFSHAVDCKGPDPDLPGTVGIPTTVVYNKARRLP
jgi:hypothetical protein